MNTASYKLSKELYNLSGWSETEYIWDDGLRVISYAKAGRVVYGDKFYPAYTLGYLVDRTPNGTVLMKNSFDGTYHAAHRYGEGTSHLYGDAGAPEDAVAELHIKLLGLHKPEEKS